VNDDPLDRVDFAKGNGLAPVIVQDADSNAVLMLGYANREALSLTLTTGRLHLFSRSRQELWLKGKASGNYLLVERLALDCDGDAILAMVRPATGSTPVCHTGAATCFYENLRGSDSLCADRHN
jgi:phosphoribosyl-AMP cyclohydrolase